MDVAVETEQMVLLTEFTYDLEKSNAQTSNKVVNLFIGERGRSDKEFFFFFLGGGFRNFILLLCIYYVG